MKENFTLDKVLKKITEHWYFLTLIITCILTFNIYYYYWLFNIPIFYLINITDVIGLSVGLITFFVLLISIIIFFKQIYSQVILRIIFIVVLLIISFLVYYSSDLHISIYDFGEIIKLSAVAIISIYLTIKISNNENIVQLFILNIVVFIFIFITLFNEMRKKNLVNHGNSTNLEFIYFDKKIKTDNQEIFIGQTNNYIFTYCKSDSTTNYYNINDLKFLKIR